MTTLGRLGGVWINNVCICRVLFQHCHYVSTISVIHHVYDYLYGLCNMLTFLYAHHMPNFEASKLVALCAHGVKLSLHVHMYASLHVHTMF